MDKKTKYKIGFSIIAVSTIVYFISKNSKKTVNQNQLVNKKIAAKFSNNNQSYLNLLNPSAKHTFEKFIKDIENLGFAVVINNSYRPTKEQIALKNKDSRNATPGYSTHEYGEALDLSVVKNGIWINKNSSLETWNNTGIPQIAKNKYNMRWGGDFKGYNDPVHFDLGNLFPTKRLYTKALKIYGTPSKFEGNKMNLYT